MAVFRAIAKEKDTSFNFSMIGAGSPIELGYYDPAQKKYFSKEFSGESFEILSLSGNVAWFEGEPIAHAHGVFGNEKYETFGGHVAKLFISVTGEAVIDWLPEKIIKKFDDSTGIKLLSL